MNWWGLFFELLGLSLLGFAYYFYQRKKILRDFQVELDIVTEEVLILINQDLEQNQLPELQKLEKKVDQLKLDRTSFLTQEDIEQYLSHTGFSEDLKEGLLHYRSILTNRSEKK